MHRLKNMLDETFDLDFSYYYKPVTHANNRVTRSTLTQGRADMNACDSKYIPKLCITSIGTQRNGKRTKKNNFQTNIQRRNLFSDAT